MGAEPTGAGKRVLIVEDETLVAMLLEDMLQDEGHSVVRAIGSIAPALAYIEAEPGAFDFAILDVNLGGQPIFPVAEALRRHGKAFAFATGYGPGALPEEWRDQPILSKPFGVADVTRLLAAS